MTTENLDMGEPALASDHWNLLNEGKVASNSHDAIACQHLNMPAGSRYIHMICLTFQELGRKDSMGAQLAEDHVGRHLEVFWSTCAQASNNVWQQHVDCVCIHLYCAGQLSAS